MINLDTYRSEVDDSQFPNNADSGIDPIEEHIQQKRTAFAKELDDIAMNKIVTDRRFRDAVLDMIAGKQENDEIISEEYEPVKITVNTSLDSVLRVRTKTNGELSKQSKFSQQLKDIMRSDKKVWNRLSPMQKEALEMVVHKIARILAGTADEPDHWKDIAGYSKLVADRLEEKRTEDDA